MGNIGDDSRPAVAPGFDPGWPWQPPVTIPAERGQGRGWPSWSTKRRVFWVLWICLLVAATVLYIWGLLRGGEAWRTGLWPLVFICLVIANSILVVVSVVTDSFRQRRQRESVSR